ncbi:MAG: class I SAM-dependent methyltransferase [Verrucomicrobiota bacterium]
MSSNLTDIIGFISRFASESTNVLEIGSGSGETAKHFALGGSKVVTVDPCITGYDFADIEHHTCFFDGAFVLKQTDKFDLIIARHILEHTFNPVEFLVNCRKLIANHGWIYVELPNVDHSLRQLRAMDFFNDHIQHFSENSLSLCGMIAGFKTFERKDILGGAHIGLLMQPTVGHDNFVSKLGEAIARLDSIIAELDDLDSFVLYGAGAHAATFVAAIGDVNRTKIVKVMDKDPNKIGKYLPGVSAPVSYPECVNTTLIVNTSVLYSDEIHQFLIKELGFRGRVMDI